MKRQASGLPHSLLQKPSAFRRRSVHILHYGHWEMPRTPNLAAMGGGGDDILYGGPPRRGLSGISCVGGRLHMIRRKPL